MWAFSSAEYLRYASSLIICRDSLFLQKQVQGDQFETCLKNLSAYDITLLPYEWMRKKSYACLDLICQVKSLKRAKQAWENEEQAARFQMLKLWPFLIQRFQQWVMIEWQQNWENMQSDQEMNLQISRMWRSFDWSELAVELLVRNFYALFRKRLLNVVFIWGWCRISLHLYLNSVIWMSVSASATSMKCWNDPIFSGMVVTNTASCLAPTAAKSATSLNLSKFMFAPLVIATTVLPCIRNYICYGKLVISSSYHQKSWNNSWSCSDGLKRSILKQCSSQLLL